MIFEKSQQRANAVAQELIRQGVLADHLQIDAVGDSQPVYYEIHAQGRGRQPADRDIRQRLSRLARNCPILTQK